ncbi:MAG: ABC transporter substrate-binding protein [Candidatus Lambdaproteobacteria bacterium]|nr:ABC transporter substrate-binding protein [Candidatus Lambdaproteobacteria bacterium]
MTSYTRWLIAGAAVLAALTGPAPAWAQKYGGVLRTLIASNPTTLSIHEATWPETTWPMVPVYSNLVWFDAFNPQESPKTIVPEMAERWAWSTDHRALTFHLRPGIRWHDGKPLTAADVQHTFDLVRGARGSGLKLNPRRSWYFNVDSIETRGDREVTFRLRRPQPAVLIMLASGYSPIYPAHVNAAELRGRSVGAGPFRLRNFIQDQRLELEKNPDYFVQGRPYLDGIHVYVLKTTATRNAALIAKQADVAYPNQVMKPIYDQLSAANAGLAFAERVSTSTTNIVVNTKRPPFDNARLRQAVSLAMDRNAVIKGVYQGGAVPGTAFPPLAHGTWGLNDQQILALPGYGDPAKNKAEARRVLAAEGYGPTRPFRVTVTARSDDVYIQPAIWAMAELKEVGMEPILRQIDPASWVSMLAKRDFDLVINFTALGVEDPDIAFYENFKCGSQRNFSDYCNPELEKEYDRQSQETDFDRRHSLVNRIDIALQQDVARPYLAYRKYYYAYHPHVKNWVPHQSIYNGWRMSEIWLDQ